MFKFIPYGSWLQTELESQGWIVLYVTLMPRGEVVAVMHKGKVN